VGANPCLPRGILSMGSSYLTFQIPTVAFDREILTLDTCKLIIYVRSLISRIMAHN